MKNTFALNSNRPSKTVLNYRKNGTTYQHTFPTRVGYPTVEQYLVMEQHIGLRDVSRAIVLLRGSL